jgi:phenylalanyl-tRNA synthetase beta chain
MTYPLIGKELLTQAMWPVTNEELVLVNALSVDHDRMRPSIIPHAIEMSALNHKNYDQFAFFELGRSYLGFENERSQLLIGFYSKKKTRFIELENTIEKLLSSLNISFNFAPASTKFKNDIFPSSWTGIHPHEFQNIQIMGKFLGGLTTVHPLVLKNFKMKGFLSLAVIDLTDLENREQKDKVKYTPIAKFPSSSCDFTIVMKQETAAAEVLAALKPLKIKELKEKCIVDVFSLNDAEKTVTIRTVFSNEEKTLTSEEIKNFEAQVIQVLEKAGFFLRK